MKFRQLWLYAVISIAVSISGCGQGSTPFDELDAIVADTSPYEHAFQKETTLLRHKYAIASSDSARFVILKQLFNRYRNFRVDSAMIISKSLVTTAKSFGNPDSIHSAMMNYADALNKSGMQVASIEVLNRIPRTDRVKSDPYFYYLCHTAYLSLAHDNMDQQKEMQYRQKLNQLKDTMISITPKGSSDYVSNIARKLSDEGRTEEAISEMERLFKSEEVPQKNKAALQFQLAEIYLQHGDTARATDLLVKSSISDLTQAKKVYMSLQKLAMVLYMQGDVERAYTYITKSITDINYGHAIYRLPNIAEYLPIINSAYNAKQSQSHRQQVIAIVLLVALAAVMLGAYYIVRRKKKFMQAAKLQLEEQNRQLKELAEDLRLSNKSLEESNHIKVEYIASLFNICSDYIKRQEELRKTLSRKLASNQVAEVAKILNKRSSQQDDFKMFISRFDGIFLSIFPDFVKQFNKLLRPEEQIQLKNGELLTPELRIYALVRLGITENTKIADFLHYSLQTVYNYRQRMRNKAINRDQKLSDRIRNIGSSEQ